MCVPFRVNLAGAYVNDVFFLIRSSEIFKITDWFSQEQPVRFKNKHTPSNIRYLIHAFEQLYCLGFYRRARKECLYVYDEEKRYFSFVCKGDEEFEYNSSTATAFILILYI